MSLAIRMAFYALFSGLASIGLVDFDAATGDVEFNIYSMEMALIGFGGFIATFISSRFAKVK
jgi:hypothetical protein